MKTTSQGSAGNVIAAVCSAVIPGFGQLTQGRFWKALWHISLWGVLWVVTFAHGWWLMNIWSCLEAAKFSPPEPAPPPQQ